MNDEDHENLSKLKNKLKLTWRQFIFMGAEKIESEAEGKSASSPRSEQDQTLERDILRVGSN